MLITAIAVLFPSHDRKSSAITYHTDYVKTISDLSSDNDRAGISSRFNYWIFSEAEVFWQIMEDKTAIAVINTLKNHAADIRQTAMSDIDGEFDTSRETESHWGDDSSFGNDKFRGMRFNSPVGS